MPVYVCISVGLFSETAELIELISCWEEPPLSWNVYRLKKFRNHSSRPMKKRFERFKDQINRLYSLLVNTHDYLQTTTKLQQQNFQSMLFFPRPK